jgi:hypothetical protein
MPRRAIVLLVWPLYGEWRRRRVAAFEADLTLK